MKLSDIAKSVLPFIIGVIIEFNCEINTALKKISLEILRFGPTFLLLYISYPKNYLRSLSYFWRRDINVQYTFSIRVSNFFEYNNCSIDELISKIKEYDIDKVVFISEVLREELYIFQVENANVKIDFRGNSIYISSQYDVNYRKFQRKIKYLINMIDDIKTSLGIKYDPNKDTSINIKILYLNDSDDKSIKCTNPFWKRVFKNFNLQSGEIVYEAPNKSLVTIGNDNISFFNKKLNNINKDINKELYSIFRRNHV